MSEDFKRGAHLVADRWGYAHHGLYLGRGKVAHYAGYATLGELGAVELVSLDEFALANPITIVAHAYKAYGRDECVRRARKRLGENCHDRFGADCEHFVLWCIEGDDACASLEQGAASAGVAAVMGAGSAFGATAR